jgi:CheY-like chemotaxis protein
MIEAKASVLIVDDEPSIRLSLSQVLTEIGYRVRSAADGVAALAEIRREVPEILISDLNMPGMSGFELLSAVRRQFPRIPAIAMSGAFSGNEVPSGVTADAFYPKGASVLYLMGILESLTPQTGPRTPVALPPVWIASNGHNSSGEAYVTVECPECLKTFPQVLSGAIGSTSLTDCVFCGCSIRYAIVPPEDRPPPVPIQHRQSTAAPRYPFMRDHLRKSGPAAK